MEGRALQLISDANAEVQKHQETVESDYYRLGYHLMPPVGLLNDPNGFIQYKGTYHLFYQWNPFKTGHGAKFWGHYISKDLIHWTHEEIALAPSDWFDKNGCYSGSAVSADGKMKLFYTGNVKDEQGNRETYQCLAESEDGVHFTKKGVVVELPDGYTAHFRDPKVWNHDDHWYMIVGAQSEDLQGKAALLKSVDLKEWHLLGNIAGSNEGQLGDFGYMWECPDLFSLHGKDVLIVSPQGLKPEGMLYNNVYQSGYFVGELNYETGKMSHGRFVELDRGFEFYAPQTTVDDKGRRLLFAWMGVPEQAEDQHPTIAHQWVHAMTLPRELVLVDEKLYQRPVAELDEQRVDEVLYENEVVASEMKQLEGVNGDQLELVVDVINNDAERFEIALRDEARIIYDVREERLTLERKSFSDNERAIEARHCKLTQLQQLRIFLDTSSIELFVNEGEEVFTARLFPEKENKNITINAVNGTTGITVRKFKIKN